MTVKSRKKWLFWGIISGFLVVLLAVAAVVAVVGINNGWWRQEYSANDSVEKEQSVAPAEPSAEELMRQRIDEMLAEMSLEEKVGQMFVARLPEEEAAEKAAEYHLGGYILFGRDFADKTQAEVVQDIQSYQEAAKVPLFIAVDEEGGTVNRVSINPNLRAEPFKSPQELYLAGGLELIKSDTKEKSELLKSLGINVNFAPVADVSTSPEDFIYARSFGQDAAATAEYVKAVVSVMKDEKMGSVLKHFPGYGGNADTHTGVAYDSRAYENFVNSDFVPFEAGIEAGANVVLVAHNVVASIDANWPASLSARAHQILREDLGFDGVIITDDLVMEGVRQFGTDAQTAVMAVEAGNDLLCSTDFETQIPAVLEAVENGEISEAQIDAAVGRILKTKIELEML